MGKEIISKEKYPNGAAVEAALDGKYSQVQQEDTMSVDSSTFDRQSIVNVTSSVAISSVENLDFEVVFDVSANVSISIPSSVPTIGEADPTCRRLYSFLRGNLVVGNFE